MVESNPCSLCFKSNLYEYHSIPSKHLRCSGVTAIKASRNANDSVVTTTILARFQTQALPYPLHRLST